MAMVQLTVQNPLADKSHLYAPYVISKTNTYTGEIVPSPKWAKNCICISTNDSKFTMRVIDKDRILKMRNI